MSICYIFHCTSTVHWAKENLDFSVGFLPALVFHLSLYSWVAISNLRVELLADSALSSVSVLYIECINIFVLFAICISIFLSLIFWWQLKLQIYLMSQWGHSSISYLREYADGPEAFQYALLGLSRLSYQKLYCVLLVYILPPFSILPCTFNINKKLGRFF